MGRRTNGLQFKKKREHLTLTTPKNYTKLICKKFESDSKQNGEEPGVIFIIKYYERSTSINFDNIPSYKDSEIGFINIDFPLLLYKKDINFLHNLNFVITIKNDICEYNEEYPTSPLNIIFYLAQRDLIYEYRKRLSPYNWYEFKGLYDNSFKKFHLSLPLIEYQEDIHISPEEFPTLSIYFQKNPGYENKNVLKTFNIQIQYFKFNEPDFQEENIYIYGKIIYSSDVHYYRLKNEKKIIKIVLSLDKKSLNFSIGDQSSRLNTTKYPLVYKEYGGKMFITLKPEKNDNIFLNIFEKEYISAPCKNYVFKYVNIEDESEFIDYKIKNDNGTIELIEEQKYEEVNLTIIINKIDIEPNQANVTYILKMIKEAFIEDINSIFLSESNCYNKYFKNLTDKDGKIIININGDFLNWNYIQIIAQIEKDDQIDYVAYNEIKNERRMPTFNDEIYIKQTDNNKIKEMGNDGIFEIITSEIDNYNIFKSYDIENYSYNTKVTDENNNLYNVDCYLWKTHDNAIRIICKIDDNDINKLSSGLHNITLYDADLIYSNILYTIKNEIDYLKINKLNKNFSFLYYPQQTINILDKNYTYNLKFKIASYYNEKLILYDKGLNNYVLEDCKKENKELNCKILKTNIEEILEYDE